jgi:hypothetical protein
MRKSAAMNRLVAIIVLLLGLVLVSTPAHAYPVTFVCRAQTVNGGGSDVCAEVYSDSQRDDQFAIYRSWVQNNGWYTSFVLHQDINFSGSEILLYTKVSCDDDISRRFVDLQTINYPSHGWWMNRTSSIGNALSWSHGSHCLTYFYQNEAGTGSSLPMSPYGPDYSDLTIYAGGWNDSIQSIELNG